MIRHALLCGLAAATLAACEPAADPAANTALQQDIERLENEIGRLEFRVYQLENAVLNGSTVATPDEPAAATPAEQAPGPAGGRYDLTPVD